MILDRFRLVGKVAIVTGAGRGIGRAIAETFAEVGADVVCSARTQEQIDATAAKVRSFGRRALAVACDVNERSQLEHLVAETLREFGRVDVVVNNAGGWPPKGWQRTNERFLEGAFRFNVTHAFLLSRMAIPHMREQGGGAIVNVSSAISRLIDPGFIAYGTSKAALNYMTRALAAEVAPTVRVNAIAVGAVDTSALRPFLNEDLEAKMASMTPMRRIGQPEDIALMALYLASSASSWVTGKIFEVDGGTDKSNWPLDLSDL
ncbi:MAG TPA: glucose 1-dehydrogenase [Candidatus Eisenbacteria bacterium]|nr:glucose 1-dehydrogenase [Candidatus Eisenbacteria bacterium]